MLTAGPATNDLHLLKRSPSQLRQYVQWTRAIKAKYESMVNYISQERLHWGPTMDDKGNAMVNPSLLPKDPVPLASRADYKILRNDWPYGCDPGIHHLVIWMKTKLPVEQENGDLTLGSRALIEHFVRKIFIDPLAHDKSGQQGDRVLWFKNWTALQSVRALEHFHILVKDVSEEQFFAWTGDEGCKREEIQELLS